MNKITNALMQYCDNLRAYGNQIETISSLTSYQQWWHTELCQHDLVEEWITESIRISTEKLYGRYVQYCGFHQTAPDEISLWGKHLKKLGIKHTRASQNGRRISMKVIPNLNQARTLFEKYVNRQFIWPSIEKREN